MKHLFICLTFVGCIADLQDSRFQGQAPPDAVPSVASCEWHCDQVSPWVVFPTDDNRECKGRCGAAEE